MYKTDKTSKLKTFLKLIPNPSSIAVVTSYRTGSTALCDYLSRYMNVENFDETFHSMKKVKKYKSYQSAEYCVLKIMQDQIVEPYWTDIKERFILVGLYRKDLAKQAASWYVSRQSNKYHVIVGDTPKDTYKIPIDVKDINAVCQIIFDFDIQYQEYRPLFDIEFAYEDIENEFNRKNTKYVRYIRPINYDEILTICQNYFSINNIDYETRRT